METNRWIILQSLKIWKEIFTENLYTALSFILWIFQTTHCLTLVVVLGSLASLPILPISRNSFSFIRLWSSCHFCFKTNKYSELDFFFGLAIKFNIFSLWKQRAKWLTFCINKNKFSSWAESNLTAAAAMMEWMLSITWLVWPTYITKKQDWKTNLLRAFWFLYIQVNAKHKVSLWFIEWRCTCIFQIMANSSIVISDPKKSTMPLTFSQYWTWSMLPGKQRQNYQ